MPETQIEPRRLWAARRDKLGLSIRGLAKLSGVAAPYLSLMERGRGIPTSDEYDRIIAALDAYEAAHGPQEAA
jgi:transcriptional regulator with XRE-family HTH domain